MQYLGGRPNFFHKNKLFVFVAETVKSSLFLSFLTSGVFVDVFVVLVFARNTITLLFYAISTLTGRRLFEVKFKFTFLFLLFLHPWTFTFKNIIIIIITTPEVTMTTRLTTRITTMSVITARKTREIVVVIIAFRTTFSTATTTLTTTTTTATSVRNVVAKTVAAGGWGLLLVDVSECLYDGGGCSEEAVGGEEGV